MICAQDAQKKPVLKGGQRAAAPEQQAK